jgi:hypothetical protein
MNLFPTLILLLLLINVQPSNPWVYSLSVPVHNPSDNHPPPFTVFLRHVFRVITLFIGSSQSVNSVAVNMKQLLFIITNTWVYYVSLPSFITIYVFVCQVTLILLIDSEWMLITFEEHVSCVRRGLNIFLNVTLLLLGSKKEEVIGGFELLCSHCDAWWMVKGWRLSQPGMVCVCVCVCVTAYRISERKMVVNWQLGTSHQNES